MIKEFIFVAVAITSSVGDSFSFANSNEKQFDVEKFIVSSNVDISKSNFEFDIFYDIAAPKDFSKEQKIEFYTRFNENESLNITENVYFNGLIECSKTMPIISVRYNNKEYDECVDELNELLDFSKISQILVRDSDTLFTNDTNHNYYNYLDSDESLIETMSVSNNSFVDYRDIKYDNYRPTNYSGKGIKIGIAGGIGDYIDLNFENFKGYDINILSPELLNKSRTGTHLKEVLSVMTGKYGIAPLATTYVVDGDSSKYSGFRYIDEFVKLGVDIIELSVSSKNIDKMPYFNYIVYNYGITIVAASNNPFDTNYYQPSASTNVISVGSINTNYKIASGENNIPPSETQGYRIVATGAGRKVENIDRVLNGTSYAAPAVAGTVALMMEKNSYLKNNPALVMATLGNSANMNIINRDQIPSGVNESMTSSGIYSWSGVGALDINQALWLCGSVRPTPNIEKVTNGTYELFSINDAKVNQRIYLTHCWLRSVNFDKGTYNNDGISDLDILLCDSSGKIVARKSSTNSALERLDFKIEEDGNYFVKVRVYSNYSNSGLKYGITCVRA